MFRLLTIGLDNDVQSPQFDDVDWDAIIRLSIIHGVVGQFFYSVKRLKGVRVKDRTVTIDSLDYGQLYTATILHENYLVHMWESASSLADYFASNDIRTLVVKDYSSAVLYPHHKSRSFCNLDCFVFSGNSAVDYGSMSYMQTIDSNAMS